MKYVGSDWGIVGVVDLNLQRNDFYKKEITFQVSCSYGPGRYDEKYEQGNQDYPYGYVRWTQQRNFEAVLTAIQSKQLKVNNLITDRFCIDDAIAAYDKVQNDPNSLGVILKYSESIDTSDVIKVAQNKSVVNSSQAVVGVIGAGNFSKGVLLPALAATSAELAYIADLNGVVARHAAKKFNALHATTDYKKILEDDKVKAVFIVVGHNLHARFICEALRADKHVFVEKPLALNKDELKIVVDSAKKAGGKAIMVGFNRRFSPHIVKIKELIKNRIEPLCMNMTVNAGFIPADSWVQDTERGGGRIIGEVCHFIDLLLFLTGSEVENVSAMNVTGHIPVCSDKMSIMLKFADGSIGTINYFANGSKSYPKEMLEIFSDGRVIRMENFKTTRGYGFINFRKYKTLRQDKGHKNEIRAFINNIINGGKPLISFEQIVNVTKSTFAALDSASTNRTILLKQDIQQQHSQWTLSNLSYNCPQQYITCETVK